MNLLTLLLQTTDTLVTPPVLTPTVETAGDLNLWELALQGRNHHDSPFIALLVIHLHFLRKAASHQTSRTRRQYVYGTD